MVVVSSVTKFGKKVVKILSLGGKLDCLICIWQNFDPTLANFLGKSSLF